METILFLLRATQLNCPLPAVRFTVLIPTAHTDFYAAARSATIQVSFQINHYIRRALFTIEYKCVSDKVKLVAAGQNNEARLFVITAFPRVVGQIKAHLDCEIVTTTGVGSGFIEGIDIQSS